MRGKSGHSSAAGIQRDADKSNRGQMEGYDVFMLNSCHLTVEYVDMLARYVRVKIAQERLQSTIAVLPLENK